MSEDIEMVYSTCAEWFDDWVLANSVDLVDEWDLSKWLECDMRHSTQSLLTYGFHSARAKNDALIILRAMYYEYFLFKQECARREIRPNDDAVERLPRMIQTSQKSAAWHAESRNLLSGHEFGGVCVGGPGERMATIAKKCAPIEVVSDNSAGDSRIVYLTSDDGTLSPFKWGWRYEPVARQLFEQCIAGAPVFDGLGRIRHPTLARLGASPDGLIMAGPRRGRLVEIKCPITRIIDGKIPVRYYCQMQLQAEVCDVDAVDYVEVQLAVAKTFADIQNVKQPWIGKVCVAAASADSPPATYTYEYSPLYPNTQQGWDDVYAWAPSAAGIVLENCIWYVKDWHATTVLRNKRWWVDVGYPAYIDFWREVDAARSSGTHGRKALFIDSDSDSAIDAEEEDDGDGAEGAEGAAADADAE